MTASRGPNDWEYWVAGLGWVVMLLVLACVQL